MPTEGLDYFTVPAPAQITSERRNSFGWLWTGTVWVPKAGDSGGRQQSALYGLDSGGTARALACDADGHQMARTPPAITGQISIADLASAGTATAAGSGIDLGSDFGSMQIVAHKLGTASAGESLAWQYSRDGATWYQCPSSLSSAGSYSGTSSANMYSYARPLGRYARPYFTNGATQQSASAVLNYAIFRAI